MKITAILLPLVAVLGLTSLPAQALPNSAVGQCSGTKSGTGKHPVQASTKQFITAVADGAGGYTVTLTTMPDGGAFAGFVLNASSGTLKALGGIKAATCNAANAMQHTESSTKMNIQFAWTGTGTPTFNALIVGSNIKQTFTSTLMATAGGNVAPNPSPSTSAAARLPSPSPSTTKGKPTTAPKASATPSPSPSAAAIATDTGAIVNAGTGGSTTGSTTGTTTGSTTGTTTGSTTGTTTGSTTGTTAGTGNANAATPAATGAGSGTGGPSGMTVGIAIGAVAGVVAFGGIGYMVYRRNLNMVNQPTV